MAGGARETPAPRQRGVVLRRSASGGANVPGDAARGLARLPRTIHAHTSCRYTDHTNGYADPEDLAIIKEAAKRRGTSEAEIICQGIPLAAMANRVWNEPLFSRLFEGQVVAVEDWGCPRPVPG
jgi:hypothetical protein